MDVNGVREGDGFSEEELSKLSIEELRKLNYELERKVDLPFLYGWKWYKWALEFYESTNKINLLTAANQISKSSTQIRKCINWATDQNLWPSLWSRKPVQFWYLYPTQKQVNAEFETKWKLFLPRGEMKDDPYYGYTVERNQGNVVAIHFFSGVHVYFKTYSQNVSALQSGTCDAIFCDEELPADLYPELIFRLAASDGYFHMVFTATMGQEFWRLAMEPLEHEIENLPHAFKRTVSLYEAQFFTDGSPSHWTAERIQQVIANCKSTTEIEKRVYGRFILASGRKYEEFDMRRHLKPTHMVPKTWLIYGGADPGSGGTVDEMQGNQPHYPALIYVAVSPDYRKGRVFLGWIGDDGTRYTSGDIVDEHLKIKRKHHLQITDQWYDFANRDFYEIALRNKEHFSKAEKRHDVGVPILNTLFKHDMLQLYDSPEMRKLATELATLKTSTSKRQAKDNFADALRYACAKVPWDFTLVDEAISMAVKPDPPKGPLDAVAQQIEDRRKSFDDKDLEEEMRVNEEFAEWNEQYGQ